MQGLRYILDDYTDMLWEAGVITTDQQAQVKGLIQGKVDAESQSLSDLVDRRREWYNALPWWKKVWFSG